MGQYGISHGYSNGMLGTVRKLQSSQRRFEISLQLEKFFFRIGYGLYVVTSNDGKKDVPTEYPLPCRSIYHRFGDRRCRSHI